MTNFVFYDSETSGLNKMFGQIFQFAAILTDENFQILDQFEIRSRRMPHIVPDPGALLVTGVTPEQLETAEDTYYSVDNGRCMQCPHVGERFSNAVG